MKHYKAFTTALRASIQERQELHPELDDGDVAKALKGLAAEFRDSARRQRHHRPSRLDELRLRPRQSADPDQLRQRLLREAEERVTQREAEAEAGLEIITAGFRALAAKCHPDVGGSKEAMVLLNRARERLKANV